MTKMLNERSSLAVNVGLAAQSGTLLSGVVVLLSQSRPVFPRDCTRDWPVGDVNPSHHCND